MTKFSFGLFHLYSLSLLHMLQLRYCSQSDLTHRRDSFCWGRVPSCLALLWLFCFLCFSSLNNRREPRGKGSRRGPRVQLLRKAMVHIQEGRSWESRPKFLSIKRKVTGKQEEKSPRLLKCSRPSLTHFKKKKSDYQPNPEKHEELEACVSCLNWGGKHYFAIWILLNLILWLQKSEI